MYPIGLHRQAPASSSVAKPMLAEQTFTAVLRAGDGKLLIKFAEAVGISYGRSALCVQKKPAYNLNLP